MADEQTAAPHVVQRHRAEPALSLANAAHLKLLEELLVALRRATKDIAFYPSGHPTLQSSLERVTAHLRKAIELENPLTLTITREAITHSLGIVGKGNLTVQSFAADLFLAQIRKVHVGEAFTLDELKVFLSLATMDPKKLMLAGGPEAVLTARKVANIQVNALRFKAGGGDAPEGGGAGMQAASSASMMDAVAPAQGEELREGPTQSSEGRTDVVGEIVGGKAEAVDILLQVANAPVVIQEESATLVELLNRLETADAVEYPKVARRLEPVAHNTIQQSEVEPFLLILSAIARHRDDGDRPGDIRLTAARWIDGIVDGGALDFLVERLCRRDAEYADEIEELLARLGEPAVGALLARLGTEENMSARRRLVAAIVHQGDLALPHVLRGLQDGRWFVVRNMAMILADLGNESSVETLGHHVKHADRRVRREVVRAIAKLGGRQAHRLLRECLGDGDAVVRQAAIAFLGAARDSLALPPLVVMAEERARDPDGQDVRKAAILALGHLGNATALPLLARLLRRGSWFRRAEPEDVRIAVATALGLLGGPEAVDALQRAQRSGGRVGEACQQALERLGA